MKLSETKRIFNQWKKFNLINEIDEKELGHVKVALQRAMNNPSDLPFNDKFQGKLRMIVPIGYNPYNDEGTIGVMLNTMVAAGWSVDLNTGIASKTFEREFEGVKRTQTRQMKVNALWTTFLGLLQKYEKGTGGTTTDPEILKVESQINSLMGKTVADAYTTDYVSAEEKINDFIKTWQTEAPKIKGKMSGETKFSVLMSRNPVDILRMSDFEHISSCHSPPSSKGESVSYYRCAVTEARQGGLIAFLVNTNSIKKVDLEQPEIFEDPKREISGIIPIARVRLRFVRDDATDTNLAVPERKVYGIDYKGFIETVDEWALTQQTKEISNFISHVEDNQFDVEKFKIIGGTYVEDYGAHISNLKVLFSEMFSKIPELKDVEVVGETIVDPSAEREVQAELGITLQSIVEPIINEFNYNMIEQNKPFHCSEQWGTTEEELGSVVHPELFFFQKVDFKKVSPLKIKELYDPATHIAIKRAISDAGYFSFCEMVEIVKHQDATRICIYPSESAILEEAGLSFLYEPVDLREYLRVGVELVEEHIDAIFNVVENQLKKLGIYKSSPFKNLLNDLKNDTLESEWDFMPSSSDDEIFVSATADFEIPFSDLGSQVMTERQALKLIGSRNLSMIKKSILMDYPSLNLSKNKSNYTLDIEADVLEDSISFMINLTVDDRATQQVVQDIIQIYETSFSDLKSKILDVILASTPAPKTKLQEFKNVSSLWKKFIL